MRDNGHSTPYHFRMRVLLTNDDGYDAPGIRALHEAVRLLPGIEIIDVIAPLHPQSGKSHAISASFTCHQREAAGIGAVLAVDGTPGDCVRALFAIPDHPRPDWVLSGINRGGNLGVDVYYSGTVAAARESAIHGIPAIAISQYVRRDVPDDWDRSRDWTSAMLAALLGLEQAEMSSASTETLHAETKREAAQYSPRPGSTPLWNINLPCLTESREPEAVRLVPYATDAMLTDYDCTDGSHPSPSYTYTGEYQKRPYMLDTDIDTVFSGGISLTPLAL